MLPEIIIKPLKRFADERGFFSEIFRKDWKELFENDEILQANFSITYPGIIRAWHRHLRGQIDYFLVIKGAAKICAYDEETKELDEIVSTGMAPQIVKIPGKYWHGFKALGNEETWIIYFVNKLYDYDKPDEERRAWNDPKIIPKKINGNENDPRCGRPWDWLFPPYK